MPCAANTGSKSFVSGFSVLAFPEKHSRYCMLTSLCINVRRYSSLNSAFRVRPCRVLAAMHGSFACVCALYAVWVNWHIASYTVSTARGSATFLDHELITVGLTHLLPPPFTPFVSFQGMDTPRRGSSSRRRRLWRQILSCCRRSGRGRAAGEGVRWLPLMYAQRSST